MIVEPEQTEVDAASVAAFRRDGVVLLRGRFTGWVDRLRAGVERNLRAPGPYAKLRVAQGGSGVFFNDYRNWQRIPEYEAFIRESPAAAVAAALMGAAAVRIFHEHVLVKEPGAARETPWHHDQPYYCVDGAQNCSLWLALDAVPRTRGMEFLAGSHRWGRWFRPLRFDLQPLNDAPAFEDLPDIEAQRARHRFLAYDVAPGDAIAFHFLTLHAAAANFSTARRRAFSTRWVGEDARFAERGGAVSPPFPDVALRHGAPLEGPQFPVVWSRPPAL